MSNTDNSSPTLTYCTFSGNSADYDGGGMLNMNNSSPTVTNCTFTANSAQGDAGGMLNMNNSSPTITNCTFSGNSAGYFAYGGGMYNHNSNPTIANCIMWADTAYFLSDEIYNDSSTPSISYSDVAGCGGSGAGWDASLGTDEGGNIDADPLFVSAADLHLQDSSPCIDAGINSSVPTGVTTDIDGELRIIDGDGDILAIVDMGADEYLPVQPQVWVDDDYTPGGGNDGHSWGINAFSVIQTGIGAAGYGSTVYVAAGTYVENITLKNGVKLFGAGPLSTTIDADASGSVVTSTGCDPNTILTGFTITNGYAIDYGGGMYNEVSRPTITDCMFRKNAADFGGGMYNTDNSGPALANCTFTGNSADYGAGIFDYNNSSPMLTNCTFSGNSAVDSGGGMFNHQSSPAITNCVLWDNTAADGNEITLASSSTIDVNYCDIKGGQSDIRNDGTGTVNWGSGNITDDPLFVDADGPDNIFGTEDDNLRLSPNSPCIDAGDNNSLPADTADLDGDGNTAEPIPFDLDGHPRIIDGDCNDTDIVDMDAYEFNYAYMGDFDYDCDVDFEDFGILGLAWLTEPGDENWNQFCDIGTPDDDYIDWADVKILCDNWLAGK